MSCEHARPKTCLFHYCETCLSTDLAKEQKKVGELMREGVALGEFEDRQRRQIDLWKSKAERLAEALKNLTQEMYEQVYGEHSDGPWIECHPHYFKAKEALADYGKETK